MFFRWTAKVFYIVLLLVLSCSVHVFTRTLDPGHVLSILGKSNYSISNQQHISISKTSGQFLTIYILQPIGYLVMSEHPALPELVAYSFENEFGAFSEKNPLLTLICAGSEATIRFYNEKHPEPVGAEKALPVKAAAWQWPPQGSTTTGGWLKENWTQDAPYNSLCPMDLVTRTRSLAGCPAIAMGQIINFHKTTNATMFTDADDYVHNYAGRTYRI
ncbi:MAG: C10 family peptidase, partial [Ignavibacteria bacterium]|nr:C10 family peptidase [Ignavibacteria bacterium]